MKLLSKNKVLEYENFKAEAIRLANENNELKEELERVKDQLRNERVEHAKTKAKHKLEMVQLLKKGGARL